MFANIGRALHKLVGLEDDDTEALLVTSDRTEVEGSLGFTSVEQSAVTGVEVGQLVPETFRGAVDISGTKKAAAQKFFYVCHEDWKVASTHNFGKKLIDVCVDDELLKNDLSVTGFSKYNSYMRFGLEVMVQVNCNQYQLGSLLCAMVPGDEGNASFASYTVFPHGIINNNINNSVRIKVPWVCTRPYKYLHRAGFKIWRLVIIVISPLKNAALTDTSCTVVVTARFCDTEFHGPIPFTNMYDSPMTIGPSAFVANLCNTRGANATLSMALADEEFLPDGSCAGLVKFTNLSQLTRVPSYCGKFEVSTDKTVGQLIWLQPVCPQWYEKTTTLGGENPPTTIASVAAMFNFWSGDFVYHLQAVITRFHSGRLIIFFYPGDDTKFDQAKKITLANVTNCMCAVFDLNGVGSTCVFRVPWCSPTPYAVTQTGSYPGNDVTHWAPKCIGYVGALVYSKLVAPQSVAKQVEVNVWVSMCNADFYSPILTRPLGQDRIRTQANEDREQTILNEVVPGSEGQETVDAYGSAGTVEQNTPKDDPPEKPNIEVPVGAVTSIEDPILMKKKPQTFPSLPKGRRRHTASHMNVYNLMGRGHWYTAVSLSASGRETSVIVPIRFTRPSTREDEQAKQGKFATGVLQWFFSCFHLFRGSIHVTVEVEGGANMDVTVWWSPPGATCGPVWSPTQTPKQMIYKSACGLLRFNSTQTSNVQFRIPWYHYVNAISAFSPITEDQEMGNLVFDTGALGKGSKDVRFHIFFSFGKDAEFYFPRPPTDFNFLTESNVTTWLHEFGEKLEEVFNEHEPETIGPEEIVRPASRKLHAAVYRGLRLAVGQQRLKYAQEEWERGKKSSNSEDCDEFGDFVTALSEECEIYTNAGDMFADGEILQKREDGVLYRGIAFAGNVYSISLSSKHTMSMPAVQNARFSAYLATGDWLSLNRKIDPAVVEKWAKFNFGKLKFNYAKFAKGKFGEALGSVNLDLVNSVLGEGTEVLFNSMLPRSVPFVDKMMDDTEIGDGIKLATVKATDLMGDVQKFMVDIRKASDALIKPFIGRRKVFALKVVSCLVKFATRMFIAVRSKWDGATIAAIALEMGLDTTTCCIDVQSLLSGLLKEIKTLVGGDEKEVKSQSLELRDVVSLMTIGKNVKSCLEWAFKHVSDWFHSHYGNRCEVLEALTANEEKISALVRAADEYASGIIAENEEQDYYNRGAEMLSQLRTLMSLVKNDENLKHNVMFLRDCINGVVRKMNSISLGKSAVMLRPEPLVLFLHGPRGSGKSLAATAIAVKICKVLGVDFSSNIYSKPLNSDFWDGYANQMIVMFDDIGQATDDGEWKDFCQLVSGCPFRCDMAHLSEKGKHFTSPIIICTSNFSEPSPITVHNKEAILRRLHLRVGVQAKDYYSSRKFGFGVLDVQKAKSDGSLKDLSCLDLQAEGGSVTLDEIVDAVICGVNQKYKNYDDMIDMWTQSKEDKLWFMKSYPPIGEEDSKCSKFFQSICNHKLLITSAVIGTFTLVGVGVGLYKWLSKHKESSDGAYENNIPKHAKVVRLDHSDVYTQSVVEASNLIQNNLYRFGVSDDGEFASWRLNCLGVKNDWIVVPSHAIKFTEFKFVMILRKGVVYANPVEKIEFYELGDGGFHDLVLFKMPGFPKSRDITQHFVRKCDLSSCDGFQSTLATVNAGYFQMIGEGPIQWLERTSYNHSQDGKKHVLTIAGAWRGSGQAYNGSCGGVLISGNQRLNNPFIGIHTASGDGKMISCAVWREMFDVCDTVAQSRIASVQVVSTNCHMPSRSEIQASPIQGFVPDCGRCPAAMPYSRGCECDVISNLIQDYASEETVEPPEYDMAMCALIDDISKKIGQPKYRPLTEAECIGGVGGLEGVNFKTSAGLPYCLHGLTKHDLLDKENCFIKNLALKENVEMGTHSIWRGNSMESVFMCTPKDELRKTEKVKNGITRFIMCAPLDLVLVFRRLFGYTVGRLQSNPGWDTHIAVGIDPDTDWDWMVREALRFGDSGLDIDFRGFDKSVCSFMIHRAMQVLCWFSANPESVADGFFKTISQPLIQVGNLLMHIRGSLPSGTPATSVCNSLINSMNLIYCFSKVLQVSCFDVSKLLKFITYGDDVVVILKRGVEYPSDFCDQLTAQLALLGMHATSSNKGPVQIVPVLALTFLKREFHLGEFGLFQPKIEQATILSLLRWKRRKAKFEDNLNDALWFGFHHGREYYYWLSQLIVDACQAIGDEFLPPTYEQMKFRYLNLPHVQ